MLVTRRLSIPALLSACFISTICGGQRRDSGTGNFAAHPPGAPADATPARAKTPEHEPAGGRACDEKPTAPQLLPDREYGRLLFKEFDALYETGRFGLGYCVAEVEVNEQGTVGAVHVVRPRPVDERLNQAITKTQAVRRYKPALACGQPVTFVVTVGISHCPVRMDEGNSIHDSEPRYLVTDSAIDVAMGIRLCVAVDPADKHGIWWWGPGATGCDSRSTGPDLFHPSDASVVRSADSTILSFRLGTHSDTRPFVDVRLKVAGTHMRSEETAAQVSLQRRTTLDVPLVPPRGR